MSVGDGRGSRGAYLAGREFVIVMVVFFSSLTFTLGFFVGKKTAGNTAGQPLEAVQAAGRDVVPQSAPSRDQSAAGSTVAVPPDQEQVRRGKDITVPEPAPPASSPAAGADGMHERRSETGQSRPVEERKRAPKETPPTASPDAGVIYCVQLGALKNQAEARKLKETYSRKGYTTYITATRLKNREKIYKVKAGEFHNRQDAELLAIKLKKSAGLHAFVTLKEE